MTASLITVGTSPDGKPVRMDLDRVLVSRMLLQANSGGGKSWALRRLLEQTHGRVQHLVLDIEGEFHTLREKYDYVLVAKTGGDTLADVRSAPLLARRLLELGVSAILDLYELKAGDRIRFVRLFLEALIDAPRALWHPALVIVDEAHHFCPQVGQAESANAVIDLMTRGRKRGFCGVLATQRLSKLHKDAAAEANVKLIGRAALDVDMKRAADELGITSKEDLARLRSLPTGRFFAFGPGISDQVVEVQVGEVQTTHPRAGKGAAPAVAPREKVRKVLEQLQDLPKEAEQEARTLSDAQKRIKELEREVRAKPATPEAKVERVEVPVLKDEQIKALSELVDDTRTFTEGFERDAGKLVAEIRASAAAISAAIMPLRNQRPVPAPRPVQVQRTRSAHASKPEHNGHDTDPRIGKCERAILTVLAQFPEGCMAGKLTLLSGYRWTGSFRNSLGALRSAEMITGQNMAVMQITPAGVAELGDFDPLPMPGADLQRYWLTHSSLGICERKILTALIEAHPHGLEGDWLTTRTNYEWTGSFRNSLGALRTAGLIVGRNTEIMRASKDLFA